MSSFLESLKQPFVRVRGISLSTIQRNQYDRWRYGEFLSAGFSLLGLIVQTIDYERRYSPDREHFNCVENSEDQYYRWLCVGFSLAAVAFQVLRHTTKHQWEQLKAKQRLSSDTGFKAKPSLLTIGLLLDLSVLCIFPFPYVSGRVEQPERYFLKETGEWADTTICYTWAEVLYVLMFLRVYLILRCLFVYYSLMDRHSRFTASHLNVKANIRFTIRSLIRLRPYTMLFLFWIPISVILAIMIRVFERPFQDCTNLDFEPYYNALWMATMTITTVNFADFYPSTHLGRVVAQIAGIWGLFLISMMVLVMTRSFSLTWKQQEALQRISLSRQAAKVIIAAFLMLVAKKRHGAFSAHWKHRRDSLETEVANFKQIEQVLDGLQEENSSEVAELKPMLASLQQRMDRQEHQLKAALEVLYSIQSSLNPH